MADLDDLDRRRLELAEQHRRLQRELAAVADYSAEVHEQAAQVHEDLASPLLSPEQLREHAREDRDLAARERAAADGDDG